MKRITKEIGDVFVITPTRFNEEKKIIEVLSKTLVKVIPDDENTPLCNKGCTVCFFYDKICGSFEELECRGSERTDESNVHFEEVKN